MCEDISASPERVTRPLWAACSRRPLFSTHLPCRMAVTGFMVRPCSPHRRPSGRHGPRSLQGSGPFSRLRVRTSAHRVALDSERQREHS
ncbi:MAG: hypothetical protein [Microviridae sp.]|nr:MAG: hypothetical protein [Microviridae sp.]